MIAIDFLKEYVERIWKKSYFLFGDHFINSHNLISWQCMDIDKRKLKLVKLRRLFRKWIDLELANFCLRAKIWFTQKERKKEAVSRIKGFSFLLTTVSVKIVGTLLCLLVPSMLVYKIWWPNRDKQLWEGQGEHEKEKNSVWFKCPNYIYLRLQLSLSNVIFGRWFPCQSGQLQLSQWATRL